MAAGTDQRRELVSRPMPPRQDCPQCGEFYEITGPDDLRDLPDDWIIPDVQRNGEHHFLFYFRDETFECLASDWSYEKGRE